jgi:hypothetical protein
VEHISAQEGPEKEGRDWLSAVEHLVHLLDEAPIELRTGVFLDAMCHEFGWTVAEYWALSHGSYQIACESHEDTEPINRFERESVSIVVPARWVQPERWTLNPAASDTDSRMVSWSAGSTLSGVSIRRGMISEAGLKTQVAIRTVAGDELGDIVMLFHAEARSPSHGEIKALSMAAHLLRWATEARDAVTEHGEGRLSSSTTLDSRTRQIIGPLGAVRLTSREWDAMVLFTEREGTMVSFRELTEKVWRSSDFVGKPVVYDVVGRLRKRLRTVGGTRQLVSIPGHGYMLE